VSRTTQGATTTATPTSTDTAATTTVQTFGFSLVTKKSRIPSATSTSAPRARTSMPELRGPAPLRSAANWRQAKPVPASATMAGMMASSGRSAPSRFATNAPAVATSARPRKISVTGVRWNRADSSPEPDSPAPAGAPLADPASTPVPGAGAWMPGAPAASMVAMVPVGVRPDSSTALGSWSGRSTADSSGVVAHNQP
jgi:hypothetical protein